MKIDAIGELISKLATSLECFVNREAAVDLLLLGKCFQSLPDMSVSQFCEAISNLLPGLVSEQRKADMPSKDRSSLLISKITHFLENRDAYDVARIRSLITDTGQLTVREIKTVGETVGCPVSGKKASMVARLENWLLSIKRSADQSTFKL